MNLTKRKIISVSAILIIIVCIIIYNIKNPIIKDLHGYRESIEYNGQKSVFCSFYPDFTETEYLGLTEDKDFKVYAYRTDSNYNLFTLVGSDNTDCYKTDGFVIPTSGNVTKVFIDPAVRASDNKVMKKQTDIEMFKKLVSYQSDEGIYHINNVFTDGNEICFAYDNCPVATYDNLVGYIAYIDDNWIIVSPGHYQCRSNSTTSNETDLIGSKITDSELIEWLNQNSAEVAPQSYKYR